MDTREREIRARLAAVPCGYAWLREDVAWLLAALDAARAERDAAVAAERERCARVCEGLAVGWGEQECQFGAPDDWLRGSAWGREDALAVAANAIRWKHWDAEAEASVQAAAIRRGGEG